MAAIQQALFATARPSAASNGLLTSLVSAFESNEASGNLLDSHGGLTFTANFSPGNNTGLVYATVRELVAASNQSFQRTDDSNFSLGSDTAFSWEVWVYFNSLSNGQIVINKGNVTGAGDEYLLWLVNNSGYKMECYVGNGSSSANVLSSTAISASTWYHIVFDHDPTGDVIGLTVNNGTRQTTAWSGGTQDTSNDPRFGSSSVGGNYMDGRIGPIRFWKSRVLDSTNRSDLYNSGAGLPYSSFTA